MKTKNDPELNNLLIKIEETLRSYSFSFDCDYHPKPAKELNDLADQISDWIDEIREDQ